MDFGRTIKAPAERVWEILTDTQRWPEWGPSVTAVECGERVIREGSRGRVRTPAGLWVPFEVTAMEPGKSWRWRVAGIAATGHRVEPIGPDRCRLVFEVPWFAAPYGAVCQLAAGRIARLCKQEEKNNG